MRRALPSRLLDLKFLRKVDVDACTDLTENSNVSAGSLATGAYCDRNDWSMYKVTDLGALITDTFQESC
jgi:hypothetical protein